MIISAHVLAHRVDVELLDWVKHHRRFFGFIGCVFDPVAECEVSVLGDVFDRVKVLEAGYVRKHGFAKAYTADLNEYGGWVFVMASDEWIYADPQSFVASVESALAGDADVLAGKYCLSDGSGIRRLPCHGWHRNWCSKPGKDLYLRGLVHEEVWSKARGHLVHLNALQAPFSVVHISKQDSNKEGLYAWLREKSIENPELCANPDNPHYSRSDPNDHQFRRLAAEYAATYGL